MFEYFSVSVSNSLKIIHLFSHLLIAIHTSRMIHCKRFSETQEAFEWISLTVTRLETGLTVIHIHRLAALDLTLHGWATSFQLHCLLVAQGSIRSQTVVYITLRMIFLLRYYDCDKLHIKLTLNWILLVQSWSGGIKFNTSA